MKHIFNFPLLLVLSVFGFSAYLLPANNSVDNAASINHDLWTSILQAHVSSVGVVDYQGIKNDNRFKNYLKQLSSAKPINSNWSNNEKKAFWINAYNAFTIELIIKNWPVKSIKDINKPWDEKFITINNVNYSLNHIEHQILRKMGDPRIHFGIVCASYSCPILLNEAYEAKTLDGQLKAQAIAFVNDSKRNVIKTNEVQISKLFSWFKSDFTVSGSLINFLNQYSKVKINENAKISYLEYNWSLNNK